MQVSEVTRERLQRLAAVEAPEGCRVLSLYLNLDPTANLAVHQNRRSAVTSLLDAAHRAVEGEEDLTHDGRAALRDDVNRAREELDAHLDGDWAQGAHALALFLCGPADLFEVVRLPRPLDARVHIADRPAIEPLAEVGTAERWAVLVLDGDDARLFEGQGDRLEESGPTRSARGGVTDGTDEHEFVRGVAEMLREADAVDAYARIAIGTTERLFGVLEGHLPEDVAERVIGRFDAGADAATPTALSEKVQPLLIADETRREKAVIDAAFATGVRGLADTLPALYERRVGTLLLEPGLEHPGVVCPRCRWAVAEERGACPVDGETMHPHPDVVEWAVELAVEQDAAVVALRRHDDLADYDGIAAALRF